jgi:hypothetical protein
MSSRGGVVDRTFDCTEWWVAKGRVRLKWRVVLEVWSGCGPPAAGGEIFGFCPPAVCLSLRCTVALLIWSYMLFLKLAAAPAAASTAVPQQTLRTPPNKNPPGLPPDFVRWVSG